MMRFGCATARLRPGPVHLLLALLLLAPGTGARAERLQLSLPDGKTVNADYRRGDARRPAVLVLHGFLQTYEFLATQNIINGLSEQGNTVLGPNLSLGTPNRQTSAQCQAAHQHTFEGDLREVDFWVRWLRGKGHRSVILVGHSWGSQLGLGYVLAHPQAPVAGIVAISLVRTDQDSELLMRQIATAEARAARRDVSLQPYALGFCKAFMANPASFLSYARWGDDRVLSALEQLRSRDRPVYAIVGSEDRRIDPAWIAALRQRVSELRVVEGANHFFSSIHEFELVERLLAMLARLESAPTP